MGLIFKIKKENINIRAINNQYYDYFFDAKVIDLY